MVFKIVARVVARVITEVVARVVAEGDEVYQHHSSARVVTGGVCAHLNAGGSLLPSC
jgi:ferritin-like metal-binding protein YciE